ncbi:MAG: GNAT family N-acetyltransferase [Lachnospiraceae bacterium]|nr:GNAT family N-acetyltransferase [Lachnospiraceae bacterium]
MNIEVIDKETLPRYRDLILPYIYEELENCREDLADENYICLAGTAENDDGILIPIAALVMLMEANGDLAVLSIYTIPEHRRQGIASELLEKAIFVSRQLFVFEDGEDEEFINLKAVYRLSEKFKNPFEEFLKKNNFTDFYLLDEHDNPQVWAAVEEIRFYKKT